MIHLRMLDPHVGLAVRPIYPVGAIRYMCALYGISSMRMAAVTSDAAQP